MGRFWKADMTTNITRARVIQLWCGLVAVLCVAWLSLDTGIGAGTAALLFALSLGPPAMALMLWPGPQALTAGDVLRGK